MPYLERGVAEYVANKGVAGLAIDVFPEEPLWRVLRSLGEALKRLVLPVDLLFALRANRLRHLPRHTFPEVCDDCESGLADVVNVISFISTGSYRLRLDETSTRKGGWSGFRPSR